MRSQIKNLFFDPAGLFVDGQRILDLRVPLIAQGDVSKGTLFSGEFGVEGSLDFPAGIFGIPFVEQVFEWHEVGQALFGVLVLGDGNVKDLLFREDELQIVGCI